MGEVVKAERSAPVPASAELVQLTDAMRRALQPTAVVIRGQARSSISLPNAPTEAQRKMLAARHADLVAAVAPIAAETPAKAEAILGMFRSWPQMHRMDVGAAARTASSYTAAIVDLPLWAIRQACESMTRENRQYVPSAGVLRAAVVELCQPCRVEAAELARIIAAEVLTPPAKDDGAKQRVRQAARSFARPPGACPAPQSAAAAPRG